MICSAWNDSSVFLQFHFSVCFSYLSGVPLHEQICFIQISHFFHFVRWCLVASVAALQHHFHSVCIILYAHIIRTLQQVPHNSNNKTHCCFFFVQLFFSSSSSSHFSFTHSKVFVWKDWRARITDCHRAGISWSATLRHEAHTIILVRKHRIYQIFVLGIRRCASYTSKLVYFDAATITVDYFRGTRKFPLSILQRVLIRCNLMDLQA